MSTQTSNVTLYHRLGEVSRFYFNPQEGTVELTMSDGVDVFFSLDGHWTPMRSGARVEAPLPDEGLIVVKGNQAGHHTAQLIQTAPTGEIVTEISIDCFCFNLGWELEDGRKKKAFEHIEDPAHWVWGKDGTGPILLVNCLEKRTDFLGNVPANKSRQALLKHFKIQPTGVTEPPNEISLFLYATPNASRRFAVYAKDDPESDDPDNLVRILGTDPVHRNFHDNTSIIPIPMEGLDLYMEALQFPDGGFEGLITLELHLQLTTKQQHLEPGELFVPAKNSPDHYKRVPITVQSEVQRIEIIGISKAVFRVAPWIMTPSTQPAEEVYVCLLDDGDVGSSQFVPLLREACKNENVPLRVLTRQESGGSPFIQDEVEFGYMQSPLQTQEVVCASMIRGLLRNLELLRKNLGLLHIQEDGSSPSDQELSTLDSFGNLEVSPPVTVRGRKYPLGRILFGGNAYGGFDNDREVMPAFRRFLYAQKVQSPIEIYTDWLRVGHVDEILTFIPADTEKKFKLLLASPDVAHTILKGVKASGHGSARMFSGKTRCFFTRSAATTVNALLKDDEFWSENARFQRNMDMNRRILMEELDLSESDIVDVPQLFLGIDPCRQDEDPPSDGRTSTFFPNMVNHLVLNKTSIVPKPYGPRVHGECVFETYFKKVLPGRKVVFLDDWNSYYVHFGDIHCATNTRRKPLRRVHWWEFKPDAGFDV